MKLDKQTFLAQYSDLSERDRALLERSYDVLHENTIQGDSMPWGPAPVISPWLGKNAGIWNWDSAFHAMTVSRFDTELAKSCIDAFMSYQKENGLLPDVMRANGNIEDDYGKPPVMPWAACIVFEADRDMDFLRRNYDKFIKLERFLTKERSDGILFYYSAQTDPQKDDYLHPRWESGWDNSPRWDICPIVNLYPVDLNCFMVLFYRSMAKMAEYLSEDSLLWKKKEKSLAGTIESMLYDETQKAYVDRNRRTGAFSTILSPASFMPLFAGIASPMRAAEAERLAKDPTKFYPGMPTVSYDCPGYDNNYWRGPTWLNVAFFAVKGLYDYGYRQTAREIRAYLLDMCYQGLPDIFENYDSKSKKGKCCRAFSWSAAFLIEFILQFRNQEDLI